MDVYQQCPLVSTARFTFRLIQPEDCGALYRCYHDPAAVARMNDDNCDFGFYVDTPEKMRETLGYWLDFYQKRCFVRFAVIDRQAGEAAGTIEGFGGDTGVLRVDLSSAYETADALTEIFSFAVRHFRAYFGNEALVTKAVPLAQARRDALKAAGWTYIGHFRGYSDYFQIKTEA